MIPARDQLCHCNDGQNYTENINREVWNIVYGQLWWDIESIVSETWDVIDDQVKYEIGILSE